MRFILPSLGLIMLVAFIRIGTTAPSPRYRPVATSSLVAIECAPPEQNPAADASGRFIIPLPGLGHHTYTISSKNDSTQFYFNQGLNFYYSYHLREALASFKEAAIFDTASAMPYWGEALASGPYYNTYTYKMRAAVPSVLAVMMLHRSSATEKEQALIDVMQTRYSADMTNADRDQLDKTYGNGMAKLVSRYPADDDIKALYIDAVMLEHKWDFYTTDGAPKQWTPELVALCQGLLRRDPHQPAALHYYIHLTEASNQPGLALAAADQLKDDMPGVGHMVHMSTHMYQRNGLFEKGVEVNEHSMIASNTEDSLAPMLGLGRNNILHVFAVQSFCAINAGMYEKGLPIYQRARDKCIAAKPPFPQDPYSQYIYMLPDIAWVRLGKWDKIIKEAVPDRQWKYATLLSDFARGMAFVHQDDLAAAKAALESLKGNLADSLLNIRLMPFDRPSQCGKVAAGILAGEIFCKAGHYDSAIAMFNQAVAAEDALIYREPQQWMLPVRQYLGATLLKINKPIDAARVYRIDLAKNPGNGWSLLGLYQSLTAQHQGAEADKIKTQYLKAFAASDVNPVASVF